MSRYTDGDVEYLIDHVCESRFDTELQRNISKVARDFGSFKDSPAHARTAPILNPDPIRRLLWGLAVNIDDRQFPYRPEKQRTGPANCFDKTMVLWAIKTETKAKVPMTKEKLAEVIRRDLAFVEKLWSTYGEARGRKPFFPAKE